MNNLKVKFNPYEKKYFIKYIEGIDKIISRCLRDSKKAVVQDYFNNSYGYYDTNVDKIIEFITFCKYVQKSCNYSYINVIDLGCGTGKLLKYLEFFRNDLFESIKGFEIQKELIKIGTEIYNVNIKEKDLLQVNKYDFLTTNMVFLYEPFNEHEIAKKFITRLIPCLRSNCHIYLNSIGIISSILAKDKRVMRVTDNIFMKL